MAQITTTVSSDEKTYQMKFYESLFGADQVDSHIRIDKNTDGYTQGILFEHKTNVLAYGRSRALSQALIYLTRFNAEGSPIPGKIMLICQEHGIAYIYDANEYKDIINNIPKFLPMKASIGIDGFVERTAPDEVLFDISSAAGMRDILQIIEQPATYVKADISIHNVYGWSEYYYKEATVHGQKPEKKAFFVELRNPIGTLSNVINPWIGKESDFTLIMDLLNDPMTQKKLGAFYTPKQYCELAHSLLKEAIHRVPVGNDYIILDRCAGTGNLEDVLSDEELSHVIINTYELKEWYVLKDRIGKRVRYLIPPIPVPEPVNVEGFNTLLDEKTGFLSGANALDQSFIDTVWDVINKTKKSESVTIILYENPPYAETTSLEFQRRDDDKHDNSAWKKTYVVNEMKKEVKGAASNDLGNAFIWSAFKYFVKNDTDSYVVFSPIKYWKAQHIIDKEFISGYAVNRRHFHTDIDACIMLALWGGKDKHNKTLRLKGINLDDNGQCLPEIPLVAKKISTLFSDVYYDKTPFTDRTEDGILIGLNGEEATDVKKRIKPIYSSEMLGYLVADSMGFDNPDAKSSLLIAGRYNGNGFYLHKDSFVDKLPLFCASRYITYNKEWTARGFIMKSGDGHKKYFKDIKDGKLDDFLCQCLIFSCFEPQNHCRSLIGSDGRVYINNLCFDGEDTIASQKLAQYIAAGYVYTQDEEDLMADWQAILKRVEQKYSNGKYRYPYDPVAKHGYNSNFKYGLYQIDIEVNYTIDGPPDRKGKVKQIPNDGDLNNMIKSFKSKVKDYYLQAIVPNLFHYEFLK